MTAPRREHPCPVCTGLLWATPISLMIWGGALWLATLVLR